MVIICIFFELLHVMKEVPGNIMAKEDTIKKGDVVMLRSGGPKMTVQTVGEQKPGLMVGVNWVRCIWFENNIINEYNFDATVLKVISS